MDSKEFTVKAPTYSVQALAAAFEVNRISEGCILHTAYTTRYFVAARPLKEPMRPTEIRVVRTDVKNLTDDSLLDLYFKTVDASGRCFLVGFPQVDDNNSIVGFNEHMSFLDAISQHGTKHGSPHQMAAASLRFIVEMARRNLERSSR